MKLIVSCSTTYIREIETERQKKFVFEIFEPFLVDHLSRTTVRTVFPIYTWLMVPLIVDCYSSFSASYQIRVFKSLNLLYFAVRHLGRRDMQNPETSLIARAEALNAFNRMQAAATAARRPSLASSPENGEGNQASSKYILSCFCFGVRNDAPPSNPIKPRPHREYNPDNLSAQPERHPWSHSMEWLILACIDLLEEYALNERNLFAVSAVDDLVRNLRVPVGAQLPANTDPHVAAGAIKMQMRYATDPLVPKECLASYIEDQAPKTGVLSRSPTSFAETHIAKAIERIESTASARRAYLFARFMRLLGRVSANMANSGMNAHSLAKCVAPSMLHWDPYSGFALLMLGKITGYVMTMIEEARKFDEVLCQSIGSLRSK